MYKKILWPFLILISSCSNQSEYIDDREQIVNGNMITSFLQLSECISINATPGEKFGVIQANLMNPDIRDMEGNQKYRQQSQEDLEFLLKVAEKKCPSSLSTAINAIQEAKSKEARGYLEIVLQDIVVSVISSEIMTPEDKKEVFKNKYQSLGKDQSLEELY